MISRARIARHPCSRSSRTGFIVTGTFWAEDSDVVPMRDLVPKDTFSHYCVLLAGKAACCGKAYIAIAVTLASGEPDDLMRDQFFFHNADPGQGRISSRQAETVPGW
jgi:hypothetical protein